MRNERIKVQTVQTSTGITAFVISFRYPHRFVAQHVTERLVMGLLGKPQSGHGNPGPAERSAASEFSESDADHDLWDGGGGVAGAGGFALRRPNWLRH